MKDWKFAAGTAVIAGALALPASSGAMLARPAVSVSAPVAPCYQAIEPNGTPAITIGLTGGVPTDGYVLAATIPGKGLGSAGSADGNFDASGNATVVLKDVYPPGDPITPTKGRPVSLSVEQYDPTSGDTTTQLGTALISEAGIDVADKPNNPRKARYVTVAGTKFAGKQLYGFVTNKAGTKLYKRFYIGKGDVCGYARKAAVVAPASVANGTYKLYVNAGTKLNKKASDVFPFQIYTTSY